MSFWLSQGPSYPWNPSRKNTDRIPSRKTRNGQRATDDINCTIFWRVVECSILLRLVNYCSLSMEISRNFGILQFGIPQSWRITWRITRRTPQVHHTAQERNWWDRNLLATCEELTQLSLFVWKETHKNHYFLSFTEFTWLVVWNMFFFHNILGKILPIDELIFFKMVETTNQLQLITGYL
jgi:hypothetical protein